jgi:hypothetical protein
VHLGVLCIPKKADASSAAYFKVYSTFTETHFPDHLEQLNAQERARLEPFLLPRLPRGFIQQHFPYSATHEGEKQRRKEKSDVLAPLHSLLVALVRFRKQSTERLLSAYQEALSHARRGDIELPLSFSYEEERITINRDARTIAEVQLEKRPITLRFLLWDRRMWVLKHPNDYGFSTKSRATRSSEEFAEQQFFVECLNPTEELLWFGDLTKYRLLQDGSPQNIAPEDAELRQQIGLDPEKRLFRNFRASNQAAGNTRWRNNSKLPRPNILRFMYFNLVICPSTGPLL